MADAKVTITMDDVAEAIGEHMKREGYVFTNANQTHVKLRPDIAEPGIGEQIEVAVARVLAERVAWSIPTWDPMEDPRERFR